MYLQFLLWHLSAGRRENPSFFMVLTSFAIIKLCSLIWRLSSRVGVKKVKATEDLYVKSRDHANWG